MRVVVFGATGNVGTAVVRSLIDEPAVEHIVGVARRRPDAVLPKVTWEALDITGDPLDEVVRGADVVVHLAWAVQPSHDGRLLRRVNVTGSARVLSSVVRTGVPTVVYASSVGTYAAAPAGTTTDESWPHTGIETSEYSRDKADVEFILDTVEADHPEIRIVRLRKALVFQREGASEIKRLFLGPLVPIRWLGRHGVPLVPGDERFSFQVVHADDVGEAYRLAVTGDARGAFNIAADPVITPEVLAEVVGGRTFRGIHPRLVRGAAWLTHRLRLQRTEPGWIDLALGAPMMSTAAATSELGWQPSRSSTDTLGELLKGLAGREGTATPPLEPVRGGTARPLHRDER